MGLVTSHLPLLLLLARRPKCAVRPALQVPTGARPENSSLESTQANLQRREGGRTVGPPALPHPKPELGQRGQTTRD